MTSATQKMSVIHMSFAIFKHFLNVYSICLLKRFCYLESPNHNHLHSREHHRKANKYMNDIIQVIFKSVLSILKSKSYINFNFRTAIADMCLRITWIKYAFVSTDQAAIAKKPLSKGSGQETSS